MIRALLLALVLPSALHAEQALIAAAANFAGALDAMAPAFAAATGHEIVATTGSSGKLYAQITHGAPYDVLLSADAATPARLLDEGLAIPESRQTYAIGRLVLWSPDPVLIAGDPATALGNPALRHLAIANPDLAPYGAAARAALQALGLWEGVQPKLVMGENVGQAHALVGSGAADAGFVALSAIAAPGIAPQGVHWEVPQHLFPPIRQDAVLLAHGTANPAAHAFLDWLRTPEAGAITTAHGYAVP